MYNSKTQINVLSTAWQAPDDTVGAATTQSARKQSAFRAQKFSVGDACFRQQLRRKVSTDCELLHRNSEVPPRRKGSWCNLISSVATVERRFVSMEMKIHIDVDLHRHGLPIHGAGLESPLFRCPNCFFIESIAD